MKLEEYEDYKGTFYKLSIDIDLDIRCENCNRELEFNIDDKQIIVKKCSCSTYGEQIRLYHKMKS